MFYFRINQYISIIFKATYGNIHLHLGHSHSILPYFGKQGNSTGILIPHLVGELSTSSI